MVVHSYVHGKSVSYFGLAPHHVFSTLRDWRTCVGRLLTYTRLHGAQYGGIARMIIQWWVSHTQSFSLVVSSFLYSSLVAALGCSHRLQLAT